MTANNGTWQVTQAPTHVHALKYAPESALIITSFTHQVDIHAVVPATSFSH